MIDKWFKSDLQNIYRQHNVAVFIDESGDAEFLLKSVEDDYTFYHADSELEELHVKYLIEKAQPCKEMFLIYTTTKKDDLKFIREYCETCGCLEIRYLQNYIKDKIHKTLNLNINLSKEEVIAAAKVSVGKDATYWMDISHKGAAEIFDLEKELLPFIHDPDAYSKEKYDDQLREIFYMKVNELLGQENIDKPAQTLANEIVKTMLNGLAEGNCNKILESVYQSWLDSVSYKSSFKDYLRNFTFSNDLDIWNVCINHPFREIDELWLAEIGNNIAYKTKTHEILLKLRKRNQNRQAQALGIIFWKDVIVLLEFDPKDIAYLSSFGECVDFYKKHFYKLDTAIRNLYTEFLNNRQLLEPFQDIYKEYVSIFLDQWFKHWSGYRESQTGTLQRIIEAANGAKTAVIVGDGVAYEIAEKVAEKVKGSAKLIKNSIIADIPSETENNMSRLYMDNGITEAVQSNREKYLKAQNPNLVIDFIRLDEFADEVLPGQFLICTYKDLDDMGEKLQQKALKYFSETIDFFADKISALIESGYSKVYLITDHGFVLTGILSESDKVSFSVNDHSLKSERYIWAKEKQANLIGSCIEIDKKYKEFNYLYLFKGINPFKTRGVYGFSHGGATPQEVITPYFCWESAIVSQSDLSVEIVNKNSLLNVTGEIYQIQIKAADGGRGISNFQRRMFIVFFSDKKQISKTDVFQIDMGKLLNKDYTFDGYASIEAHLLDADTKELLDKAAIKKNNDRDLGGLL